MNLAAQSKSSYSQLGSEQEGHTCQLPEWVHLWSPACFAENQGGPGNRGLRPLSVCLEIGMVGDSAWFPPIWTLARQQPWPLGVLPESKLF